MAGKTQIEKHKKLMDQMADRLGSDLDEAELRGELAPGARNAMVLSCTNCASPEECQKWLAAHDSADQAPEFCRNGEALAALGKT
jgi:Family of unknown function (DUF6455)